MIIMNIIIIISPPSWSSHLCLTLLLLHDREGSLLLCERARRRGRYLHAAGLPGVEPLLHVEDLEHGHADQHARLERAEEVDASVGVLLGCWVESRESGHQ